MDGKFLKETMRNLDKLSTKFYVRYFGECSGPGIIDMVCVC